MLFIYQPAVPICVCTSADSSWMNSWLNELAVTRVSAWLWVVWKSSLFGGII